jgi:hypothetical protein
LHYCKKITNYSIRNDNDARLLRKRLAQTEAHLVGAKKAIYREKLLREKEQENNRKLQQENEWLKMVDDIGNNPVF